ncbi:hypothetical protein RO3G_17456 [Rhizopus delemar RA 99-880]|uniref:Uncharacterized protein n=1 Tax=Rhizopus delemar (strain RA 99-880 / ATCC MYA-4621 / FGSC 9543 / NRRL 43880) TaxID=246409 RepID=I1CWB4_RHIO9|nr:hypothetical protein RO3G_17456 [Rhizopus delemar RA 99-880]|eukprot:EIE92744.1 hypothetical protein RO3G_17456 [Rhizopus delemar RA 99-880]
MEQNDHYTLAKTPHVRRQIEDLLLPGYGQILENPESVAFQHASSSWKLLQARACYIILCINNPHLKSDFIRFRLAMLKYIYENFEFIPKIAKDRIWTVKKGLLFYEI